MGLESPPYLPTTVGAVELPFERGFRVPKIRVRIWIKFDLQENKEDVFTFDEDCQAVASDVSLFVSDHVIAST